MANNYFFAEARIEDYFLQSQQARIRQAQILRNTLTPQHAINTVQLATTYPTLPKAIVAAAAPTGITADDPVWDAIATRNEVVKAQDRGWFDNLTAPLRGLTRWAFTTFDMLWQEGVSRPFKSIVGAAGLADQGAMSFAEAWRRAGTSAGAMAFKDLFARRPVNLGEGFIPESTDLTDFPEYRKLIDGGTDPATAAQLVQRSKGRPVTDISLAERSTGLTRGGRPVSPGRFVADQLWVEPGTTPYNLMSGALDAAAQIWADPSAGLLKSVSAWRAGSKIFGGVDEAVAMSDPGFFRNAAGLLTGHPHAMVHQPTASSWLSGRFGRGWTEYLDQHYSPVNFSDGVDLLQKQRHIGRSFFRQAADGQQSADLFRAEIAAGRLRGRPDPNRLNGWFGNLLDPERGRLAGFRSSLRNRYLADSGWDRLFRQAPDDLVSIEDLDTGFWQLNDFLVSAGFSAERRSEYLYRWSGLADDAPADEAYQIVGDMIGELGTRLADEWGEGLTGEQLRALRGSVDEFSQLFNSHAEIRAYFTNLSGNPEWHPGARLSVRDLDGNMVTIPTAHLISEFLNRSIPLPNARELRAAVGSLQQKLRKNIPGLYDGPFGKGKLVKYLADPVMQKVWKPLTLLRIAWPMRVIPEEAVRMSVTGLDSWMNHPIRAMGWMMHNPEGNVVARALGIRRRGASGVLAAQFKHNATDGRAILASATQYQAAMSRRMGNFFLGTDSAWAGNAWKQVRKGEDVFTSSWAREMYQLIDDEIGPMVAGNRTAAKQYLRSSEGQALRRRLSQAGSDEFSQGVLHSDEAMDLYVDSVWARIHEKTGGEYDLIFDGQRIDPTRIPPEMVEAIQAQQWGRIQYRIVREGNQELIDTIATGEWRHTVSEGGVMVEKVTDLKGASDAEFDEWAKFLGTDDMQMVAPLRVKGPVDRPDGGVAGGWNRMVEVMFQNFMSRPTNFLSRSPTFRQMYWRRVEELIPFMSPEVAEQMLDAATKANLPGRTIKRIARRAEAASHGTRQADMIRFRSLEKSTAADEAAVMKARQPGSHAARVVASTTDDNAARALGFADSAAARAHWHNDWRDFSQQAGYSPQQIADYDEYLTLSRRLGAQMEPDGRAFFPDVIDDLEHLDEVAKAYGLESTKALLYDTTKRNQLMDQFRNIFPFGEAWLEIVSTWRRLLYENPVAFRRGQQMIEGARGSGFFEVDPETGEEMFNYPGGGLLTRMLFGSEGNDKASLRLQGRVQGLNLIMGQWIPGFGPMVQIPASHLLDAPAFDGIKRLILPFGDQKITEIAALVQNNIPGYLGKVLSGIGIRDTETDRLYANTVMDVYKMLLLRGADDSTAEKRSDLMNQAKSKARWLTLVRGMSQSVAPTGPEVKFVAFAEPDREQLGDEVADQIEGRMYLFQSLGSAYREKLFELEGDDVAAFDWFVKHFGMDPTIFATPKTVQVERRHVTPAGDKWGRTHKGLFDVAPYTAYFAHPDDPTDEEFDYDAYVRSIREGAREALRPEEWVQKRNDLLGRIRYERARLEADEVFGPEGSRGKTLALQAVRLWLMDQHPGYRVPTPGAPETADVTQKIAELEKVWPKHPELGNSEVGQAVAKYLAARKAVIEKSKEAGLGAEGWKAANDAMAWREALRRYAAVLIEDSEDFSHIWQLVLSHEMRDDTEALAQMALGGSN